MKTWVLLRGLTREAGHWGGFVDELRAVMPADDCFVTPDLQGNGLRWREDSPTDVEAMVAACRQDLQARGLKPPYTVLAMSLGAMVTAAWASRHPAELHACMLINTSLKPFSPFWQRLRPRQYPRILALLLTRPDALAWERAIMQMTTRHPLEPDATLAQWLALRQSHPVSTRNGLRQLIAAIRYRAPPARPPVPMLLLNSLGDQLVHPACSEALSRAWRVPLIRHPTAGHDLPLDAAPWVARQVHDWLAQLPELAPPHPPVTPLPAP
ncbi:MAG: alpha/beta hydrolase [Aquabacterium sp.]